MTHKAFEEFLKGVLYKLEITLGGKSADYSTADDKLFNFKLQARIDGCTPAEALRGNLRKHLASLIQGMDEMKIGKCRPFEWWSEKSTDAINYIILLLAMIRSEEWK